MIVVTFQGPAFWTMPCVNIIVASHVLAVPSSYEGFGIVYLEGMAFGLARNRDGLRGGA